MAAIDEVIPEPAESAYADPSAAAEAVAQFLLRELERLGAMDPETLVQKRQQRFRDFLRASDPSAPAAKTLDFKLPPSEKCELSMARA
jgi:acetyl-CoA carboxylase alpha subunit